MTRRQAPGHRLMPQLPEISRKPACAAAVQLRDQKASAAVLKGSGRSAKQGRAPGAHAAQAERIRIGQGPDIDLHCFERGTDLMGKQLIGICGATLAQSFGSACDEPSDSSSNMDLRQMLCIVHDKQPDTNECQS